MYVRHSGTTLLRLCKVNVRWWPCFHYGTKTSTVTHGTEVHLKTLDGPHEGIAVIEMNRPRARNALGKTFIREFVHHLEHLSQDRTVRAVVVRSLVSGVFCAGADLKERALMSHQDVSNTVDQLSRFTTQLANLGVPTVAALDGLALGGGFEIALACDLRTASISAKMGLVETKLAILPGAGGTQRLARILGPSMAKELIFSGRIVDGQEAKDMWLVNKAVEQNKEGDAAYKAALTLVEEFVKNGPVALRMAKFAIDKGSEVDLATGLAIEQACYARVIPTADRTEGLTAFKEKRPPVYKGE